MKLDDMRCIYCTGSIAEDEYETWGYTINEWDESLIYHHTECLQVSEGVEL